MPGFVASIALLVLSLAPAAHAQRLNLEFSRLPDSTTSPPGWEVGGLGWHVTGGRLACEPGVRTTALPATAPHASRLTFEAVMRPERAAGTEWKTAGIAITQDDANYWQLALVEGPDAAGRTRTVEMHQMLRGRWLANLEPPTALKQVSEEGAGLVWEYCRDYRLRMELTPERITRSIVDTGSGRRWSVAYALAGDCVRSGRPALAASGLAASYVSFAAVVVETAPPPAKAMTPAYDLPPMSPIRSRATGFFRVEQIDGRWWVIDPKGAAFYVVGTDHVNYGAHWCEKLGYAPYSRNLKAKYDSEDAWAASATKRLKEWGFNTLGAGHSDSARHRGLVHTAFLSLGAAFTAYGDIAPRTTWTGFPDVFDPRFEEFCAIEARRQCAPHRDDPWLLGYFIDNELEWFGKNGSETGLVDEMMKKPSEHPAKRAFVDMLRGKYKTVEEMNRRWKSEFAAFDDIRSLTELPASFSGAAPDRRDFVRLIAERYFAVACAAIRRADPNHMVLGCRFAGFAPPIWDIAGRHLDIVTVNYYGNVDLERSSTTDMPAAMAGYYREAKRPLLITEWSFPALDAGLPSRHGAGQRVPTQKDKARAYAIYQTTLFAMPYMVGSNYFMWVDEPELGISSTFPEDSNYGLVDVNDRPWPELTAMAARVNRRAVALHSGLTSEVSARIAPTGVTIRNQGAREARFTVEISTQGRRTARAVRIPPSGTRLVPMKVAGPALVMVELDRAGELAEKRLDDNRTMQVVGLKPAGPARVVVANAGDEDVQSAPISVRMRAGAKPMGVWDAAGRRLPSQVDRLPTGDELAFIAPRLPARSATVFTLRPASDTVSRTRRSGSGEFIFAGALHLASGTSGGNIVDAVRLGETLVGRLAVLAHQTNGQPLWIEPDRVSSSTIFEGAARTVRLVECVGGDEGAARTAVDTAGVYAQRTTRPHRFAASVRLDMYSGEQWFDVSVREVRSTDNAPWKLESYFIYPASTIGGSAADDSPGGSGQAPRWYDARADVSYGAVIDQHLFRGMFWKDTPDGEGQHADIYRPVQRILGPAVSFAPKPPDPPVRVFATRGDSAAPGNALMRRLRQLGALSVRVVGSR